MRLRSVRFGAETHALTLADAEEVENLRRIDPAAALSLARRKARRVIADGERVTVALQMTDAVPPDLARAVQVLSGKNTMSNTIRVGDADIVADARLVTEILSLRGQVAALSSLQPSRTATIDSAQIAANAREALRAQEARNNNPETPQGRYRQSLANAWRNPPAGAHG